MSPNERDKEKEAARKVALEWLALVDEGKYGESWEQAATLFRGAVNKAEWEKQVRGVRGPLSSVGSRTFRRAEYHTEVPGAPDGEYVIILYDTSFSAKKKAVETVTPMKDSDGTWRVSGYYIR